MNTDILETLYKTFTGKAPEAIEPLPGAGSNRRYFRLKGEQTLIGVIGTSVEENRTFLYMLPISTTKACPFREYLPYPTTRTHIFRKIWGIRNCSI